MYREKVLEGLEEGSYGYSGNLYLDILAVRHPDSDIACRDTIRQCVGETLKRAGTCGCSEESERIIRTLYALSMDYMAIPTSVGAARNMLEDRPGHRTPGVGIPPPGDQDHILHRR